MLGIKKSIKRLLEDVQQPFLLVGAVMSGYTPQIEKNGGRGRGESEKCEAIKRPLSVSNAKHS